LPTPSKRKGSFWWKDILKLIDSFKGLAMIHVSDGATCLFLDDLWNSRVPRLSYPELFSFAKDPLVSLNSEALHQLIELAQGLSDLPISSEHDSWTYIWGTPFFSSARAYAHLTGHRLVHPIFLKLWTSACQPKHKFFFGSSFMID